MHIDNLFDNINQQIPNNNHEVNLTVPNSWAQGRTLYGGLSAALVYFTMRKLVSAEKLLRSLNTSFIGPITPDVPFTIKVELLRESKNTSHLRGEIIQNNNICLVSQASCGLSRPSKIQINSASEHAMNLPQKADFIPMIPKITPRFFSHFELAKDLGGWPFTGSKSSHLHGWMRLKQAPTIFTDAHLVALIDMWPPTVLQLLRWPFPASTMNWNLEFIHPQPDFKADDWFAYQATTRYANEGYANTEANVWDASGKLVAISRQTVAVFA